VDAIAIAIQSRPWFGPKASRSPSRTANTNGGWQRRSASFARESATRCVDERMALKIRPPLSSTHRRHDAFIAAARSSVSAPRVGDFKSERLAHALLKPSHKMVGSVRLGTHDGAGEGRGGCRQNRRHGEASFFCFFPFCLVCSPFSCERSACMVSRLASRSRHVFCVSSLGLAAGIAHRREELFQGPFPLRGRTYVSNCVM